MLRTEEKIATKTLRTQRFHQEKHKLCEDFESLCLSGKAFYGAMRNISYSWNTMKKYFVYIIQSEEGLLYTGMTEDLDLRISQHNNKDLSFWTKRGNNWKLVYKEEFISKTEALKREKWFKSGVGRDYLKKILTDQL